MNKQNLITVIKHDAKVRPRFRTTTIGAGCIPGDITLEHYKDGSPIIKLGNGDRVFFSWKYLKEKAYEIIENNQKMEQAKEFWKQADKEELRGKHVPNLMESSPLEKTTINPLRDKFASAALNGILSSQKTKDIEYICELSYKIADEMLKARLEDNE